MTERLDDVWATRDYPVLREVTRRIDAGERQTHDSAVANTLGMDRNELERAARALERRGLVEVEWYFNGFEFRDVTGAAYLMTGLHPDTDDALSALVQLLRDAADQQPDEGERSRLRNVADAIGGVSRNVMQGVLTAYLTGQLPGHH